MMSVPFLLRLTMKQATVTNPGAKSGSGGKKRYMTKEATTQLHAARASTDVRIPSSADGASATSITVDLTPGQHSSSILQDVLVSASKRKLDHQHCSASNSHQVIKNFHPESAA